MKTILVLEDMEPRVEWLRDHFKDINIIWVTTVNEFEQQLKSTQVDLVILDHDIGGPFYGSCDVNGRNGSDAARAMPASMGVSVIVWSINPSGSSIMVQELSNKGIDVSWLPFHREEKYLNRIEETINHRLNSRS